MCVVSMIMDHYKDKWQPSFTPYYPDVQPMPLPVPAIVPVIPSPADIEEFRKLLERAREYDKKHNEPDCELEIKKKTIRELAESWGIKLDFL